MTSNLLNSEAADDYLTLHRGFLANDRCKKARVPFIRFGRRAVRYRIEDLDAFIESNRMKSTSQYSAATQKASA